MVTFQLVHRWWQRGAVYQIYPRSFMDASGDGVGDLAGIRAKVDYLAWLGVDAVWISPIFASPMKDMGYDVSDYRAVDPAFGTLAELDGLIGDLHAKGIKLILDLVPNHTSDRHPWFLESKGSRSNPRRAWFLWRDPGPGGGPPNGWTSVFGGSAWELDPASGQYYYHAYLKEQPDLNWRNPAVEAAMHDVIRFWLARGVDGFRVDVIWHLIKDDLLRDNPPGTQLYTTDRPEVHPLIARMRQVFDEFSERALIGEIYLPPEKLCTYYGTAGAPEANLPFNFSLIYPLFKWEAGHLAEVIRRYEAALPGHGWPNWVMGNHDVKRIATRVGLVQAPVAAVLLLTLRGSPTLYQGDELGLTDVAIPPERITDLRERNQPGMGRDPVRTPMPWQGDSKGGFTRGEPWLPLNADVATRNVEVQREDPGSMLSLYRRLLALRKEEAALAVGGIEEVAAEGAVLRYVRRDGSRKFAVALNLGGEAAPVRSAPGTVVLSTVAAHEGHPMMGELLADEAVVALLED